MSKTLRLNISKKSSRGFDRMALWIRYPMVTLRLKNNIALKLLYAIFCDKNRKKILLKSSIFMEWIFVKTTITKSSKKNSILFFNNKPF